MEVRPLEVGANYSEMELYWYIVHKEGVPYLIREYTVNQYERIENGDKLILEKNPNFYSYQSISVTNLQTEERIFGLVCAKQFMQNRLEHITLNVTENSELRILYSDFESIISSYDIEYDNINNAYTEFISILSDYYEEYKNDETVMPLAAIEPVPIMQEVDNEEYISLSNAGILKIACNNYIIDFDNDFTYSTALETENQHN